MADAVSNIGTNQIPEMGPYLLYLQGQDQIASLAKQVWILEPTVSVYESDKAEFNIYPTLVNHTLTIQSEFIISACTKTFN